MSRDNLAIVRAQYEAWNEGDMERVAAAYAADAVLQGPSEWPDLPGGEAVGALAIAKAFERGREVWETDVLRAHDFVEHGDHVIVPTTWDLRGRGPEVAMEYTNVYTVRDGKIVRLEIFRDHTDALAAVGLRDQGSVSE